MVAVRRLPPSNSDGTITVMPPGSGSAPARTSRHKVANSSGVSAPTNTRNASAVSGRLCGPSPGAGGAAGVVPVGERIVGRAGQREMDTEQGVFVKLEAAHPRRQARVQGGLAHEIEQRLLQAAAADDGARTHGRAVL